MQIRSILPTLAVAVALAACVGGGTTPGAVTITAPETSAVVPRNYLNGGGGWVAQVTFKAHVARSDAQSVEWLENGAVLGMGAKPDYALTVETSTEGAHTVEAVAVDMDGTELAREEVSFTVGPPTAAGGDCEAQLTATGQAFTMGPATPGIADAITVKMPLNGLPFTYLGTGTPRDSWVMDCKLALSMWRMADVFKKNGVVAVTDLGIYNYRCADGSLPPCGTVTGGLSIHAEGLAVDVAGFSLGDGTSYSVQTDWIIDILPSDQNTCTVEPAAGLRNQIMHALLCQLYEDRIFTIFLTPNYNPAHRNHWHMDLTPQQDEIAQ